MATGLPGTSDPRLGPLEIRRCYRLDYALYSILLGRLQVKTFKSTRRRLRPIIALFGRGGVRVSGLRRKPLVLTILSIVMIPLLLLSGCDDPPYGEPAPGTTVRYDFISTADGLNLPCSIYLPSG